MDTGELRNDGRGRHTTRHRQLLVMPGGAILIDTPGLRELQIWEGDLDSAFADIADLAAECKFNDCAHSTEPDCAVREALESGELDSGSMAELPEAPTRAARDRGEEQPPDPAGAQEPLARSRARNPSSEEVRRQAIEQTPAATA